MVAKCRTVRLAAGTTEGGAAEPIAEEAVETDSSLQSIVSQQHRQQHLLFHDITARLRRSNADLEMLCQLRETTEMKHPPPCSPELLGHEKLLTSEEAWREYERRYLFTTPSVQLPPPREVDITLLTARLAGEQPVLAIPGRTCAQGFFPPSGRSRLTHNEPRQRALLPGSRLPNTVVIRLLWSTRTLLDVQHYRAMENRRTRRRQHWEFFEWSESEEEGEEQAPAESIQRLESVATRRRNRRKISMTKHEHVENWLHIAENGTDEGAMPDSEDEAIARARRRRRFSQRGRLLSDVDGTPTAEEDAYTPAVGRFTRKKRRGKKHREESRTRHTGKKRGEDGAQGSLDNDNVSSGSGEYLDSDDDAEDWEHAGEAAARGHSGYGGLLKVQNARAGEGDPKRTPILEGTDWQVTGRHPQAGYGLSPALAADGQVTTSGPDSTLSATAGERFISVHPESPAPWTAPDRHMSDRLQLRRPTRRAARSVSPSPNIFGRMSTPGGGKKHYLLAHKVRPDVAADVSMASPTYPPPRGHALRMPNLFEVKDYVCEDSKVAGVDELERGMKSQGVKRFLYMQMAKQRMKSVTDAKNIGRILKCREFWPSSRIPGVFYDDSVSDDYELDEEASKLARETGKGSAETYTFLQQRPGSPGSGLHTSDEDNSLCHLTFDFIQYLVQHRWARELLHGINRDTLEPWEAAERLVKQMTKQPFGIQQEILREVQTIYKTFPVPDNLQPVSDGILASLYPATEDVATLTMAMDTLILISGQTDVVLTNILTLLPLEKLDVRESVQSLLVRLGLVDPHHLVLQEALSWAPLGRRRNLNACRRELLRKALGFVDTWTQAFEAHSTLIAKEVNKKKTDAVVKYNIIKILKNYEPHAIEETSDGFNVNLRKPSSTNRLKNPEVIEVLNYFVEMTDEEDELHRARRESLHFSSQQHESCDPLEWRRLNKDILVPPCPSPAFQGNRPLGAGVQQPTTLVTHWQGVLGLEPGPWPAVTVGVHLRIADKYYRGTQPVEGPTDLH